MKIIKIEKYGIGFVPKKVFIDRFGIEFPHKGDTVIYVWPWFSDRKNNKDCIFYSLSFEGYFKSLKKLDKMWKEYIEK